MLRFFGVHGPKTDSARLAAMIDAMDRALDPAIYAASRDLTPAPWLQFRLRSAEASLIATGAATHGAITLAGKVRLYDEVGDPADDVARLAAMLSHSPTGFPHRTGDFGVAAYDANTRTLRLAIDAMGAMPIYYAHFGEVLAFANWPHLLLALPDLPRDLDPVAAAAFMAAVPQPPTRTFFQGVMRLAPAQSLTRTHDGETTLTTHWRPGPAVDRNVGTIEGVKAAAETAIRARLRHTSRPVIELSGGLDSTYVAGVATQLRPELAFQAISNVLPDDFTGQESDERAYIEAALAINPSIAPGFISSDGVDVFLGAADAWDRLAAPCFDSYRFMTARGIDLARSVGADAMIGGFGGDQCLSAWGDPFFIEMLLRGRLGAAVGEWRRLRLVYGFTRLSAFRNAVFTRLPFYPTWKALRGSVPDQDALAPGAADDHEVASHLARWSYRRHQAQDASMRMIETRGLLSSPDWMTHDHDDPATGQTMRRFNPLLDPRLIEAVMATPSRLKVAGDHDRALIRSIGGDRLPPLVANRHDKMAFSPDFMQLITRRAPDIAAGFARFRAHPLWREFVDVDAAEAALASYNAASGARGIDAALGKIINSYYFGEFLERAFPLN